MVLLHLPMKDYVRTEELQLHNLGEFDLDHLHTNLDEHDTDTPQLVHIGGVSAVGKTTLSLILQSELEGASRFSIDSYLIEGLGRMAGRFSDVPPDPNKPYIGGITPEVWDMALVERDLQRLKRGENIQVPIFDETIKDRVGYTPYDPGHYVLFEGGHSFSEQFRDYADYKILVTAPFHDRLVRKIVRTHSRYQRDDIDDIVGRYVTKDEPSWTHYRDEFTAMADQVFHNPANPASDYALLPDARYGREEGIRHNFEPLPESGTLHPGEEFGFIEYGPDKFQLFYALNGKQLVNLPLEREFIELLGNFYTDTRHTEEIS